MRSQWFIALLASVALVGSCGPSGTPGSSERGAAATPASQAARSTEPSPGGGQETGRPFKLTAAYPTITSLWLGMWIAKDLGIFDKYGLEVEIVRLPGAQQVAAVLSGETHVGGTSPESVTSAVIGGADLVIVGVGYQTLTAFLVGRPELKSVAELRGRRVGITDFGSVTDFSMRRALRHFGLDPERDVEIVTTRDQPNSRAALLSGAIDAYMAFPPDDLQAQRDGATLLFDVGTLRLPYVQGSIFVTGSFLRENRDVALRYLKAYIEGISVYKKDRAQGEQVFKRWTGVTDDEVVRYGIEMAAKNVPSLPKPNLDGMRNVIETTGGVNPAVLQADLSKYVDTSLMEEIERSGLLEKLYPR